MRQESKGFFFEKKKQKTFISFGYGRWRRRGTNGGGAAWLWWSQSPRRKINKVFLLLFVHKKKSFLPL
jgi:hypothetical protein